MLKLRNENLCLAAIVPIALLRPSVAGDLTCWMTMMVLVEWFSGNNGASPTSTPAPKHAQSTDWAVSGGTSRQQSHECATNQTPQVDLYAVSHWAT